MKIKTRLLLGMTLAAILMTTGCGNKAQKQDFKADISFSGSSTLAPVISTIAQEFAAKHLTWDQVDPSFPQEEIEIYVSSGGSGAGVKEVLEGTSDFAMLARELKDDERGKLGEDLQLFTLGIDALTISIHPDNPLKQIKDDLSSDEIAKIFSGEYKYWDDLDPSLDHNEIVVVIRDLGGGAHGVFQETIMGETEVAKDAIQAASMGALVTKIMENKDAIGYASFGMVNQNEGQIIPLKVDGVAPTRENIIDASYKISRPLITVKKAGLSKEEEAFMQVLTSEQGSAIIEEMGFVPAK